MVPFRGDLYRCRRSGGPLSQSPPIRIIPIESNSNHRGSTDYAVYTDSFNRQKFRLELAKLFVTGAHEIDYPDKKLICVICGSYRRLTPIRWRTKASTSTGTPSAFA